MDDRRVHQLHLHVAADAERVGFVFRIFQGHGESGHGDDYLRLQSDGHVIVHTGGVLLAGLSGIVLVQHDALLHVSEPVAGDRMTRLVQPGMVDDRLASGDEPVVCAYHRLPPVITSNMTANGTTSWLACVLHTGPYQPGEGMSSQSGPSERIQRRIATTGLPQDS